jgi:small subunit ribosomal protein S29
MRSRIPVLLAVDDFQALFTKTAYKTPQFQSIRAWHLSMPRLILEYASGRKSFVSCNFIRGIQASYML